MASPSPLLPGSQWIAGIGTKAATAFPASRTLPPPIPMTTPIEKRRRPTSELMVSGGVYDNRRRFGLFALIGQVVNHLPRRSGDEPVRTKHRPVWPGIKSDKNERSRGQMYFVRRKVKLHVAEGLCAPVAILQLSGPRSNESQISQAWAGFHRRVLRDQE